MVGYLLRHMTAPFRFFCPAKTGKLFLDVKENIYARLKERNSVIFDKKKIDEQKRLKRSIGLT